MILKHQRKTRWSLENLRAQKENRIVTVLVAFEAWWPWHWQHGLDSDLSWQRTLGLSAGGRSSEPVSSSAGGARTGQDHKPESRGNSRNWAHRWSEVALRSSVWGRHPTADDMCVSHSVMSNSLRPHGLQPARLLCPWDSPGKNTGVGCHFLPQGIFLTQGSNRGIEPRSPVLQADSLPSEL